MNCPACGAENPEGTKFCGDCGASVQAALTCARCGFSNAPGTRFCRECGQRLEGPPSRAESLPLAADEGRGEVSPQEPVPAHPASFVGRRYRVIRFLGEGGKKRVYLAHDAKLDREVAFALLKTEGLDEEGRTRIRREAQAMGRLGDHPHIVAVYDIGEENNQPYLVSQFMPGGDLQDLVGSADAHRLSFDDAIRIADQVCQALEHAHSHGVIHRDLKPGNVWLGTDGTAKLGDFGLAVALDRSRLTQAGMMVGTVHYMAPEQAVGGEATPRSDLYSLGAMLYELVTGRPPFVGDESVAIITQHLNTPPVTPTWHNPDVPPGLEALILRLLEKDPAKRPASASEVRQLLASVAEGQQPRGEQQAAATTPAAASGGPIYQRTFIGREEELRQLKAAFDSALSGRGALVMVVGEPGIGKTALCEQLATYAGVRGGRTLVGHCYEEGSLSLPYLAFVEALRSYVLSRHPDGLRQDLGTGAGDVARIISEIRDRLAIEPRPSGDPEDDRWRLLQAVTGFLRSAATVQPILLVLEDLHWADRATLDLLVHLARNLQGARLLVVGTYRDVEVDRAHPLSGVLAELRRVSDLPRVLLRGLTIEEVHRMVNALQGQEVRWSFAEAVHRQTEGNPLFVQEVLRYLVEEGLIVRKEGRWEGRWRETGEPPPEISIPEGLRDVIGKRLSRLSAECNRLLAIAAVIGREFRLSTLQSIAGMEEEALVRALEEAVWGGVLEERTRPGEILYRFGHAFFRQTLYEEMLAPRRLRLHQEVARALEAEYGTRIAEHAAELAEHFAQSTDRADLEKAVSCSRMAAARAVGVYAYGEAVRLLEQALGVQDVVDPDDGRARCELLLLLGEALGPAGEPLRAAEEVTDEAFRLAEGLGDSSLAARACELGFEALSRYGGAPARGSALGLGWAERSEHHASPSSPARVYAESSRAFGVARAGSDPWPHFRSAVEGARQLGDPQILFDCGTQVLAGGLLGYWDEQMAFAEELAGMPRVGVSALTLGIALDHCAAYFLAAGDRARAEALWRETDEMAARSRDPGLISRPAAREMIRGTLDGDLERALEAAARGLALGEEAGTLRGLWDDGLRGLTPRRYLGRIEEALEILQRVEALDPIAAEGLDAFLQSRMAPCLAELGRTREAREALEAGMGLWPAAGPPPNAGVDMVLGWLEVAVAVGERNAAGQMITALHPLAGTLSTRARDLSCTGRILGDAAASLGDMDTARSYYEQGLEVCLRARFRPEIALIRLRQAELLLEELRVASSELDELRESTRAPTPETRSPKPETLREAQAHLDFAIKEFEAMKMSPSLERALQLKARAEG